MNFMAMIGLFVIMVPLAQIVMDHPYFQELKGKEGPKVPALTAKTKKTFILGIVITGLVSFVTAWLTFAVYDKILPVSFMSAGKFWFPSTTANCVMVWTAFNAAGASSGSGSTSRRIRQQVSAPTK